MTIENQSENAIDLRVDTHFRNVPDLNFVDFDQRRYTEDLLERGLPIEKLERLRIYLRPDYALAYRRRERLRMFLRNPFYDNISGGCEQNEDGGVTITIVYGTAYGVNALLRHETQHAVEMLSEDKTEAKTNRLTTAITLGPLAVGGSLSVIEATPIPGLVGTSLSFIAMLVEKKKKDRGEERRADALMGDPVAKKAYKKIIQVNTSKSKRASARYNG